MNHQFFTCVLPLLDNSMQLTFKANCFLKCWYFNNCILNHVTNVITESFTSESFNGKEISGIFNFYVLVQNSRSNLSYFRSVFSRTCTFSWSETIKDTSFYILKPWNLSGRNILNNSVIISGIQFGLSLHTHQPGKDRLYHKYM